MQEASLARETTAKVRQLYQLTKPRVISLIVFCAVIGMFLATPRT
ncbi:MAG: protoheme IX farnesyltransferase, partial [Burkholderiales bacterium]